MCFRNREVQGLFCSLSLTVSQSHLNCMLCTISSQLFKDLGLFGVVEATTLPFSFAAILSTGEWTRGKCGHCYHPCNKGFQAQDSFLGQTTLTDFFSLSGEPREGKLFFPEKPNPLHHPSRARKYLPYNICLFHKVWKKSLGKDLLTSWVNMGGPHQERKSEMRGQFSIWHLLFPKSGFNQLAYKVTRTVVNSYFSA